MRCAPPSSHLAAVQTPQDIRTLVASPLADLNLALIDGQLLVPAFAVTANVSISVNTFDPIIVRNDDLGQNVAASLVYQLVASNPSLIRSTVRLQINYNPRYSGRQTPVNPFLMMRVPPSTIWQVFGGSFDTKTQTLTAFVNSMAYYVVVDLRPGLIAAWPLLMMQRLMLTSRALSSAFSSLSQSSRPLCTSSTGPAV